MKNGRLRTFSVCLSDIPESKTFTAGNGKKYVSMAIWQDDSKETKDYDFSVALQRSKEEKEAGTPVIYIGTGIIHENI